MLVQKILIVDDDPRIAGETKETLVAEGVPEKNIEVVPVTPGDKDAYENALHKVSKEYRKAGGNVIVLMDFVFEDCKKNGCEKNGLHFIGDCVANKIPIEAFIGVSDRFEDEDYPVLYPEYKKLLEALHKDVGLRKGDISEKSKELLGLTEKGTETKPELDPHKQQDPPEDPPGSGML